MSAIELLAKIIAGLIGFSVFAVFIIWLITLIWWIILPLFILSIAGMLVKWAMGW